MDSAVRLFDQQLGGITKSDAHLIDYVAADLIATWTNRRRDASDEIARARAELIEHRLRGVRRDLAHGPAPTRVRHANRAMRWIEKQDRHAIGKAEHERKVWHVRDERIDIWNARTALSFIDDRHAIAVRLACIDGGGCIKFKRMMQAYKILRDVAGIIACISAEIECIEWRGADAAVPRCDRVRDAIV